MDTWNTNWLEIESLRAELRGCNLDVTLWEQFTSVTRHQDVIRLPHDENNAQDNHNVHGAEYVE